jgi:protein kinase X
LKYARTQLLINTANLKMPIKFPGTGTFGRVVLCRHHETPLALKILSMVDVIRLKQVEHLRNEISILKEVKHPFIVNM